MIDERKYLVFKRSEIERIVAESGFEDHPAVNMVLSQALPDAVVIRRQDMFAAPGLYAYSYTLLTAVEVMRNQPFYSRGEVNRLTEIADYFNEQAGLAERYNTSRLPD